MPSSHGDQNKGTVAHDKLWRLLVSRLTVAELAKSAPLHSHGTTAHIGRGEKCTNKQDGTLMLSPTLSCSAPHLITSSTADSHAQPHPLMLTPTP